MTRLIIVFTHSGLTAWSGDICMHTNYFSEYEGMWVLASNSVARLEGKITCFDRKMIVSDEIQLLLNNDMPEHLCSGSHFLMGAMTEETLFNDRG